MQQQTATPAALSGSSLPIAPIYSIDSLLIAHAIEPELQVAVPRPVTRPHSFLAEFGGTITLAATTVVLIGIGIFSSQSLFIIAGVTLLIAVFCIASATSLEEQKRQKAMLMHGIAKPAVVTDVAYLSEQQRYQITYTYPNTGKLGTLDSLLLTKTQVEKYDIHRNKTFTLLVNPEMEFDVLPYFLVHSYAVLKIPHLDPGNVATTPVPPSPVAAESGVEPELYCPAPRSVAWAQSTRTGRVWLANLLGGTTALTIYFVKNGFPESLSVLLPLLWLLGLILFFVIIVLIAAESEARQAYYYLRNGFAVPAVVVECTLARQGTMLDVQYVYKRDSGEQSNQLFTIPISQAEKQGGLVPGTRFTVLRAPNGSLSVLPYFQATGATLGESSEAKFLPPSAPTP